jgi:gluconate kinase
MMARKEHYMKSHMLHSQFEALEEPTNALTIDISKPVGEILSKVLEQTN